MRIVFFGTSDVGLPILEALAKEHEIIQVVTSPDAFVGRKQELRATPIADLANENLAYSAAKNSIVDNDIITKNNISVYPNPVVNKTFAIQFDKLPAGKYSIEINDVNGKRVITKTIAINGLQNERLQLPKASSAGLYFIKVLNTNGKTVFNDKVVVQ